MQRSQWLVSGTGRGGLGGAGRGGRHLRIVAKGALVIDWHSTSTMIIDMAESECRIDGAFLGGMFIVLQHLQSGRRERVGRDGEKLGRGGDCGSERLFARAVR